MKRPAATGLSIVVGDGRVITTWFYFSVSLSGWQGKGVVPINMVTIPAHGALP